MMHRLLKAIVVEDDPTLCKAFAATLATDPNITTAEAHDLPEAMELCRAERQVVLLVDLGLPNAKGVEAVLALRRSVPGATLVVVTGDATLIEAARAAGAHEVIVKATPASHGNGLIESVRQAVIRHDNELLYASMRDDLKGIRNMASTAIAAAKKTAPGLLLFLSLLTDQSRADAAERMRHDCEVRALAWWEVEQHYSP